MTMIIMEYRLFLAALENFAVEAAAIASEGARKVPNYKRGSQLGDLLASLANISKKLRAQLPPRDEPKEREANPLPFKKIRIYDNSRVELI